MKITPELIAKTITNNTESLIDGFKLMNVGKELLFISETNFHTTTGEPLKFKILIGTAPDGEINGYFPLKYCNGVEYIVAKDLFGKPIVLSTGSPFSIKNFNPNYTKKEIIENIAHGAIMLFYNNWRKCIDTSYYAEVSKPSKKLYKRRRVWVYADVKSTRQEFDYVVSSQPMIDEKPITQGDLFCNEMMADHYDSYELISDIPDEDIAVLNKYGLLADL